MRSAIPRSLQPALEPGSELSSAFGPALALVLVLLLATAPRAPAQGFVLPDHFEALALPGVYTFPVALDITPDGVFFVAQKPGSVRVAAPDGQPQAALFLDLTAEVNNNQDRGLLGLAVHPRFLPDGSARSWVYLLYTVSSSPPHDVAFNDNNQYCFSRLTRYRAITTAEGIVAQPGSRQVLLGHQMPDGSVPDCIASLHESHSNGSLRFADDGSLIVSVGDGAHYDLDDVGGNDPAAFDTYIHPVTGLKGPVPKVQDSGAFRAQDRRSLAGKLLRIDPETGDGYPSNPFWNGHAASNTSRIWALGLRNPFRISLVPDSGALDPSVGQPNLVLIADVGLTQWEELDLARRGGENFGWPCLEGHALLDVFFDYVPGNPSKVSCHSPPTGTAAPPLMTWNHTEPAALSPAGVYETEGGQSLTGFTGNCAIGGDFYPGGSYPPQYLGRMFLGDFGEGWIKTIEFDSLWKVAAVRPFASDVGPLCELRCHPLTGDLHALSLTTGQIVRFRYGANLTPVAVASATPAQGPLPLLVQLKGSASHDPDGDALAYDWDFGDGTPHATVADVPHAYASIGVFHPTLTVTDSFGKSSSASAQVAVGNAPPVASIVNPAAATMYLPPATLSLVGAGSDPEGGPLGYQWKVDQVHGAVVHPGVMLAQGSQASFDIPSRSAGDELLYYRIELTVTDAGGLSDSAHVWAYPLTAVADLSGTARPICRLDTLVPPYPVADGNPDIEVIRDLRFPPVGGGANDEQFATNHLGAQGADDWIGYELAQPPGRELRFVGLTFQEGEHAEVGGWWEDLRVEVREGEEWSPVDGLSIDPPYPFALAQQPYFDGVGFQTYTLRFEPTHGDAIRLRGTPGGSTGFISVAELRLLALAAPPQDELREISGQGQIIARLFELDPPQSLAFANPGIETIRNGTWPPQGSLSFLGQFSTYHEGDQAGLDWIGYRYATPRTFTRLVLQEGRNTSAGGAFTALQAQVQQQNGSWTPVAGASVSPPYPGLNDTHYEAFTIDFPPIAARAIRVAGAPAGSESFITVGELAVYEPQLPQGCGATTYGPATGANSLGLWCDTPPSPGLPLAISVTGATGPGLGGLCVAFQPVSIPTHGGTLLVGAAGLSMFVVNFDAGGGLVAKTVVPTSATLQGLSLYMQAVAFNQPAPYAIRLSNGLQVTFCGS